jgi:predicted YcjX-like family ATPase
LRQSAAIAGKRGGNMRIALTGTHRSGKTTLIDDFVAA